MTRIFHILEPPLRHGDANSIEDLLFWLVPLKREEIMSARLNFVNMRISSIPSNPALFAGCLEAAS